MKIGVFETNFRYVQGVLGYNDPLAIADGWPGGNVESSLLNYTRLSKLSKHHTVQYMSTYYFVAARTAFYISFSMQIKREKQFISTSLLYK